MLANEERIHKALTSCQRALDNLKQGNKRLAVGDLDYAKDFIMAAIHLTIIQIEDEEGKF